MSYILDALKKADAEREQGGVPGLHSRHQAPAPGDDEDEPSGRTLPLIWLGAGAALCLIAVLSWQLLQRDAAPVPAPIPAQGVAGNTAPPMAQVDGAAQGEASSPAPLPEPVPAYAPPPEPPPPQQLQPQVQPPMARLPASPGPGAAAAPPAPRLAPPAPMPAPVAGTSTAPQAATQVPATQRLPQLNELPDHIRREIPQLTIGGAMYSEVPAQRMLIVNSQVFREGDQPYQGLVLEEIRLKSAVFNFRGQRYSVNY